MNDHKRGCPGREYSCTCGFDGERDALIRELVVAMDRIRDFRVLNARAPDPIVEEALAKARAAGYEPVSEIAQKPAVCCQCGKRLGMVPVDTTEVTCFACYNAAPDALARAKAAGFEPS